NTTAPIPEPSTWVMMVLGFAGLGYAAARRSSKDQSPVAI
ncbi:MAG: PEP-CTERM sorting domain-containing protein, partial [Hyphomicrobiales bacterium]|nr:PEP-CTERM sorting domain-containing protein [Hyphomicrobiales bacterium]